MIGAVQRGTINSIFKYIHSFAKYKINVITRVFLGNLLLSRRMAIIIIFERYYNDDIPRSTNFCDCGELATIIIKSICFSLSSHETGSSLRWNEKRIILLDSYHKIFSDNWRFPEVLLLLKIRAYTIVVVVLVVGRIIKEPTSQDDHTKRYMYYAWFPF